MEKRTLLAALLAGAFLVLWYTVIAPPPHPPAPGTVAGTPGAETTPVAAPGTTPPAGAPAAAAPTAPAPPPIRAEQAEKIALESGGWRAEVDTAGGAIASLVLKDYKDATGHPLEVVGDTRPLTMASAGPWNSEPYTVEKSGGAVILRWSDGQGNWVEKRLAAASGTYGLEVDVKAGGAPARGGLVIAGSMPEEGGAASRGPMARGGGLVDVAGKVERVNPAKLSGRDLRSGAIRFAGVEDQYFLLVLLPDAGVGAVTLEGEKGVGFRVVADATGGEVRGTLFAGPKDRDVLLGFGRGLEATQSFGLFGFFSIIFLGVLRWIHGWAGNWGVAIIVLTAAIRVLLFPLTHKSTVAMKRMQRLKPKMDAIQERYKERAKKDPQVRQRMNQEVMNLYKQEGVNPMGGCVPTLVQLPILWALYTLFAVAIELRHAPFALWITDLSLKDPTYVLPILMTASMFLQQKLAPQVGDPAQRRMFMMMPLIFGLMFMNFPAGLVLYWLTNNVLTIVQQLITERLLRNEAARG